MRSGNACRKSGTKRPNLIPISPKISPTAPSENATGYPSSRKMTKAPNMIGAMFAVRNASMRVPSYIAIWRVLFDAPDEFLSLGFQRTLLLRVGIGDEVSHDGNSLHEFRQTLDQQHGKRDHDQAFGGPLR